MHDLYYQILTEGKTYEHRSGGSYKCIINKNNSEFVSVLERASDSWTFEAVGTYIDDNELIGWDWSTGGHWTDEERLQGYLRKCQPCYDR